MWLSHLRACGYLVGIGIAASCTDATGTHPSTYACEVRQRAEVPVTFAGKRVAIPIAIDGTPFMFMLDTGADVALVSHATLDQIGVKLDTDRKIKLKALGGEVDFDQATLPALTLGDITLAKRAVAVGDLPIAEIDGKPVGGVLGSDFLNQFDIDLDVPGRRLTVYEVHHCTGNFIPWPKPYAAVQAAWRFSFSELTVPVRLNDKPATAFIDTGAPYSMISRRGAELGIGVPRATIDADRVVGTGFGLDHHRMNLRVHTFSTFSIGALQEKDYALPVLESKELEQDMLIGMDFVARHRIWFSPSTTQIFVTLGRQS